MDTNRIIPLHTGLNVPEPIELLPGHLLWLPVPQTMSSNSGVEEKTRPFIVLEPATVHRFGNGTCKPVTLTGVCGTSQQFLLQGRPHIEFYFGRQNKKTYAGPDLVRSIYCQGIEITEPTHKLSDADLTALREGLDQVLRPERWFRWPNWQYLPGQLWNIKTPGFSGTAMILLRRGQFIAQDEYHAAPWDENHKSRNYAPFLALAFRLSGKVTTTRNVGWNHVEVIPINHGTLKAGTRCSEPSEFSGQTALNILNLLRAKVGVGPLDKTTQMRSAHNIFSWLFYLRRYTL